MNDLDRKLQQIVREIRTLIDRKIPVVAGKLAKDHFQDNFREGGFVDRVAMDYFRKLGAEYIYCYADQGPSDLIGEYEDSTWEEFENAIRTGKYLDCDMARREYPNYTPKDVVIFNVSDFLSGKTSEPSHSWWDIFYDDFKDLS